MKPITYQLKFLCLLMALTLMGSLHAQDIKTSLKFGNGFNVENGDTSFSFNLAAMLQSRIDVNKVFDKDFKPTTQLQARRVRLKMKGTFLHQKFDYNLQLSFSPSDVKAANIFLDGWVKYKPVKQFAIQIGQGKLPGDREEIISAERQFFVDRSTTNSLFKLDRDFGVQLFGNFGKKFIFKPRFSISSGEGKNYTAVDIEHFDYTVRLDFLPTGEFSHGGDLTFQDFDREAKPKVAFGVAYDFNNKPSMSRGQLGGTAVNDTFRKNIHSVYADAILKFKGFTTTGGYVFRKAQDNTKYVAGQSFYATASYLFKKKVEIGARYNRSFAGKYGKEANVNTVNEYAFGLAYYVFKNALKFQTDYTLLQNKTKTNDQLSGIWRFQMQLAF